MPPGSANASRRAAIQMEAELPKLNAMLNEMRENLAKSGMPPERQKAMLKMMEPGAEIMKQFGEVSPEDKRGSEPFAAQFAELAASREQH